MKKRKKKERKESEENSGNFFNFLFYKWKYKYCSGTDPISIIDKKEYEHRSYQLGVVTR